MCFSLFSRKKVEKAKTDVLKAEQKIIDLQLRTFTNHLAQISSAYDVLLYNDLQIIELLKELNMKK